MKIATIGAHGDMSSPKRLKEEAVLRGHTLEAIKESVFEISNLEESEIVERLSSFDVIYFRNVIKYQLVFQKVLPIIESKGVYCVNRSTILSPFISEKIYQIMSAKDAGLLVPKTYTSVNENISFDSLREDLGLPFVAKLSFGSRGRGVFLINSLDDYEEAIKIDRPDKLLFQKFIPNRGDFRVFVIDGRVEAMFERVSPEGQFLNNMAQGAEGRAVDNEEIQKVLSDMALRVTRELDLEVAGVDIMQSVSDGKFYFIEANNIPGWGGAEDTTGVNIGEKLISFFERCHDKNNR